MISELRRSSADHRRLPLEPHGHLGLGEHREHGRLRLDSADTGDVVTVLLYAFGLLDIAGRGDTRLTGARGELIAAAGGVEPEGEKREEDVG